MLKPASPVVVPVPPASTTLSDVVEGVLDVVAQLLHTRLAAIARIESTTYTVMAVVDQHHALQRGQLYNVGDTFCVQMLETGQPLRIDDATQAPLPLRVVPQKLELNIRAYLGVPLSLADGRVFGTLWVADPAPRHFSDNDLRLLELFARLLAPELAQAELSRHTERIEQAQAMQANVDPSTGLFAAASFDAAVNREVARHQRYGNRFAVAVLSITPSELAEERYGQGAATTLRQALADILMRTSRLVDCCARIDDDLFAVLFAETSAAGVAAWLKRIEAAVSAWNRVHSARELELDVSVGVADCMDQPVRATWPNPVVAIAKQRAHADRQPALELGDAVLS